jgi:hypothetical protein
MELWWIGADGSVQDAFWYEGMAQWQQFMLAPPGNSSTTGGIAGVSRIPKSMELWWIGADGSVQDAFWYEGMAQWQQFMLAAPGSASATGGIAGVSRIPNSMELWWIGTDGSVQDAFWYDGMPQWQRFMLAPQGSASANGDITAVSRIPNSMEVWWIGADGSVQDAFWYEGIPDIMTFDDGGLTCPHPLGGSVHLAVQKDGSFTFSSHAHNSGGENIDYAIAGVLMTPRGIAFTFSHSGHTEGFAHWPPWDAPQRDDPFIQGGGDPRITAEWPGIVGATFKGTIDGTGTLTAGIGGLIGDLLKSVLAELGKAAAAEVIALI